MTKIKSNQKVFALMNQAQTQLNRLNEHINDISVYQGYKCNISKKNQSINNYINDNDNTIYLNSRKVWYENSELTYLETNGFYYLIIYIILALVLIARMFYKKHSNILATFIILVLWPMIGYYLVVLFIEFYTFITKRFFYNNVAINISN